jgi:hypothetical protein
LRRIAYGSSAKPFAYNHVMPGNSKSSPLGVTHSVALAQGRMREQRIERLTTSLSVRLGDPTPAVDALMAELNEGAPHEELWEQLHTAAKRDGVEKELAVAYSRCADGPRGKRLSPEAQARFFTHAAEYFRSVMHDEATEVHFLERLLKVVSASDLEDVFRRLERHFEKALNNNRLLELYATVAAAFPNPNALATKALNRLLLLGDKTPLADADCKRLLALVPANARVLDVLEKHCCATGRAALAAALIEEALRETTATEPLAIQWRYRLLELYMADPTSREHAMPHVEALLERDAFDAKALHAGEKLLSTSSVASRAAVVLRDARRKRA